MRRGPGVRPGRTERTLLCAAESILLPGQVKPGCVDPARPAEALPGFLHQARDLLPSVNAIDGFVRVNQMGASLAEVRPDWLRLWVLTVLYFAIAAALSQLRAARVAHHAPAV